MKTWLRIIFVCLGVVVVLQVAHAQEPNFRRKAVLDLSVGGRFYAYAPAAIRKSGTIIVFSCANTVSGVTRDHIVKSVGYGQYRTQTVLAPTGSSWDGFHICDPSIVAGAFSFAGHVYAYALFYTGNDLNASTHNQIGVAFADQLEGPWVRYPRPVVRIAQNDLKLWGVGQPSVINLDHKDKIALFYTRGEAGTHTYVQTLELTDVENMQADTEKKVLEVGIMSRSGSPDIFHNGDFALDPVSNSIFVVRDLGPKPNDSPRFISDSLEIDSIPTNCLLVLDLNCSWKRQFRITSANGGLARNHNAGLVKDSFGNLAEAGTLEVIFSGSCGGDECTTKMGRPEWSFSIWSAAFPINRE